MDGSSCWPRPVHSARSSTDAHRVYGPFVMTGGRRRRMPDRDVGSEGRRTMSRNRIEDERDDGRGAAGVIYPADDRSQVGASPGEPAGRPRLRVQTIERTALVRFEDAEILFEEGAIREVGSQLHRLIEEEGHT